MTSVYRKIQSIIKIIVISSISPNLVAFGSLCGLVIERFINIANDVKIRIHSYIIGYFQRNTDESTKLILCNENIVGYQITIGFFKSYVSKGSPYLYKNYCLFNSYRISFSKFFENLLFRSITAY